MATALNSGFTNNINVLQVRTSGSSMQRLTDRTIDFDGNGVKERVTITTVPGGGSKVRETFIVPAGFNHTVVDTTYETDGGIDLDIDVAEFTKGS